MIEGASNDVPSFLGNNIGVYPEDSVILKRSLPPEGDKGNAVKDPAKGRRGMKASVATKEA